MKKIIQVAIVAGLLSGAVLQADDAQTIDKKAATIIHDATIKADKLVEDAKSKALSMVESAKSDAIELKQKSKKSMAETTQQTKDLANEALERAEDKSSDLLEKTKSLPQHVKQGIDDKYIYAKEATNDMYEKGQSRVQDTLILGAIKYAYLMSSEIHSTKIEVTVKNSIVDLFGKVKSSKEAEEAMQIAISIKGVHAVKSLFVIEE